MAWCSLVEALIEGSRDIDRSDLARLSSAIPIYHNIEFLLGVAEQLSKSTTITLRNFEVGNPPDEVSKALIAMADQPEPPERLRAITSAFLKGPKFVNWNTYINAIKRRLEQNSPALGAVGARRLLQLLSEISSAQKLAKDAISEMAGDGSLHGIIQVGVNEKDFELAAIAIDKLMDFKGAKWEGPAEHAQYGQLGAINTSSGRAAEQSRVQSRFGIRACGGKFPIWWI